MDELHTILASHRTKKVGPQEGSDGSLYKKEARFSEIPDLFFDEILKSYKLTRIEIMVLMYIYRSVWCRPNLYREHGISQILSHTEMCKILGVTLEEVYAALRKIEEFSFITTVRSGQYFVRKFFTKEFDEQMSQTYDDFNV